MSRRVLWALVAASIVLNAMYGAIAGILVPAQVALADPDHRETTLGLILAASSALTLLVKPLAGAGSDRTRSRWGRRSPWILGGALASAAVMLLLGSAQGVVGIAVGWMLLQPLLNTVEAPLDAVMAERASAAARPRASAAYGGGAAVGVAVGAALAGVGVAVMQGSYVVLALVFAATMIAFVWAVRGRDEPPAPRRDAMRLGEAWASPDLRRVFAARFVLVLGHHLVLGYLLYLVMDRSGADAVTAGRTASALIALHIAFLAVSAIVAAGRIRARRVPWVVAATVVIAAGLAAPLLVPGVAGLAVYAVIAGIGRGLYVSADLSLMIDLLPSRSDTGRDLGVLALASVLPQTLGPALAGLLLVLSGGNYSVLLVVAVLGALASLPIVARVRESPVNSP